MVDLIKQVLERGSRYSKEKTIEKIVICILTYYRSELNELKDYFPKCVLHRFDKNVGTSSWKSGLRFKKGTT